MMRSVFMTVSNRYFYSMRGREGGVLGLHTQQVDFPSKPNPLFHQLQLIVYMNSTYISHLLPPMLCPSLPPATHAVPLSTTCYPCRSPLYHLLPMPCPSLPPATHAVPLSTTCYPCRAPLYHLLPMPCPSLPSATHACRAPLYHPLPMPCPSLPSATHAVPLSTIRYPCRAPLYHPLPMPCPSLPSATHSVPLSTTHGPSVIRTSTIQYAPSLVRKSC